MTLKEFLYFKNFLLKEIYNKINPFYNKKKFCLKRKYRNEYRCG